MFQIGICWQRFLIAEYRIDTFWQHIAAGIGRAYQFRRHFVALNFLMEPARPVTILGLVVRMAIAEEAPVARLIRILAVLLLHLGTVRRFNVQKQVLQKLTLAFERRANLGTFRCEIPGKHLLTSLSLTYISFDLFSAHARPRCA